MESRYLLDTNIAIYLLQGTLTRSASTLIKSVLSKPAALSVISKIELLSWEHDSKEVHNFVQDSTIIALDDIIIDSCIGLRKLYKTKLPDAIIAATCIAYNFTLLTRNTIDFKKIKDLNWRNPFDE